MGIRLAAVFAHPDDDTYGLGGTLAMNGDEVEYTLIVATSGDSLASLNQAKAQVDSARAVDRDAEDPPPLLPAERDLNQLESGTFHNRPDQPVEVHLHAPSKRKVGASPPSGTALRFRTKV